MSEKFHSASLFTRKLVHAFNRPLLLNAPAHLVYIEEILAVFPEAKFIGIVRNPNLQFASFRHSLSVSRSGEWATLQQRAEITDAELMVCIKRYVDASCRARTLIPAQNLVEIRYEEWSPIDSADHGGGVLQHETAGTAGISLR